jgi:nucleotide-binding universal stress UspA family protein
MKILVGLDGSMKALEAVQLVGRLIDPKADEVDFYFSPVEMERRLPDRQRRVIDAAITALRDEAVKLLPEGLAHEPQIVSSGKPPAVGLLAAAADWQADMVVVGARGHGAIQGFLLGSVSRAVVHGAGLPVLVARMPAPGDRPLRTLVGHHPASGPAVAALLGRLTWPVDTDGRVIGVAESLLAGPLPPWLEQRARDPDTAAIAQAWQQEHQHELEELHTRLHAFQQDLPEPFRRHPPLVAQGNPGEKILERSRMDGIDLIVVGRAPTDALSRWLVGSTSEALLGSAHSSILIVPVEKRP